MGIIDNKEWVHPDMFGDDHAHKRLPLEAHGIDLAELMELQKKKEFEAEIWAAGDDDSPYGIFSDILLYSLFNDLHQHLPSICV